MPVFDSPRESRYGTPLLVGCSIVAVTLGAGISILSTATVLRVTGIALAGTLIVLLGISAAPTALAKGRTLLATARWWHWLWLLVFLSGLVFRIRDVDAAQDSPLDAWAAWRIGLMGLVAVVLLSRLRGGRTDWVAATFRGLPAGMFLYAVTALVSTLWSVYPGWTLYKSIEYLIDLSLVAAVVTAAQTFAALKSLFDLTWLLLGLLLCSVWLGILVTPAKAMIPGIGLLGIQIQGVIPVVSANGVGDLGSTLLLIAGTRLLHRTQHRSFYWLICLAALPTVIFAQSRSPITGMLLGLLAALLLERRWKVLAIVGLAGALFMTLTSAESVVQQAFLRGQSPELFYSLSGRVGWWEVGWSFFRDHPLLGLGGYAGARFAVLGSIGVTEASSIHNAWLEILLGVGLIGFLPFLATFVGSWVSVLRPLDRSDASAVARELRVETIALFVLICFRSIFSVEFTWHPPLTFFLVLVSAELQRRAYRAAVPARRPAAGVWAAQGSLPAA
jgi:O-antigen ligase